MHENHVKNLTRIWLNIVSVHVNLLNDDDGRQKSQRNVEENDVNKNMMAIPTNQHISTKLEMMWIFVHSFVDFFFFAYVTAAAVGAAILCLLASSAQPWLSITVRWLDRKYLPIMYIMMEGKQAELPYR